MLSPDRRNLPIDSRYLVGGTAVVLLVAFAAFTSAKGDLQPIFNPKAIPIGQAPPGLQVPDYDNHDLQMAPIPVGLLNDLPGLNNLSSSEGLFLWRIPDWEGFEDMPGTVVAGTEEEAKVTAAKSLLADNLWAKPSGVSNNIQVVGKDGTVQQIEVRIIDPEKVAERVRELSRENPIAEWEKNKGEVVEERYLDPELARKLAADANQALVATLNYLADQGVKGLDQAWAVIYGSTTEGIVRNGSDFDFKIKISNPQGQIDAYVALLQLEAAETIWSTVVNSDVMQIDIILSGLHGPTRIRLKNPFFEDKGSFLPLPNEAVVFSIEDDIAMGDRLEPDPPDEDLEKLEDLLLDYERKLTQIQRGKNPREILRLLRRLDSQYRHRTRSKTKSQNPDWFNFMEKELTLAAADVTAKFHPEIKRQLSNLRIYQNGGGKDKTFGLKQEFFQIFASSRVDKAELERIKEERFYHIGWFLTLLHAVFSGKNAYPMLRDNLSAYYQVLAQT